MFFLAPRGSERARQGLSGLGWDSVGTGWDPLGQDWTGLVCALVEPIVSGAGVVSGFCCWWREVVQAHAAGERPAGGAQGWNIDMALQLLLRLVRLFCVRTGVVGRVWWWVWCRARCWVLRERTSTLVRRFVVLMGRIWSDEPLFGLGRALFGRGGRVGGRRRGLVAGSPVA
ncbi:hypothetical protein CMV_027964 [Castanea mollissima]|uniref:Uncharacterized protein n=1 Tax=Castanea mollissima TaxID=60419 RepID=A0A8J4Q9I4_9ROSI|nr:hypothetical protein CMV_027964 [Castanea mollissima]